MLFAAGAVGLETWLTRPRWVWARAAYAAVLFAIGAILAPTALPMLSPETYVRYKKTLHIDQPRIENRRASVLPQFFADRCGWPEMAATVARVYSSLPAEEKRRTGIFGNDYGQAGAIDFYGPKHGLPKAIGGHLTYWFWGPREYTGESLILLGDRREVLESKFESVQAVAEMAHPLSMRQEHFTIFLCRRPKDWILQEIWPMLKKWN